MTLNTLPGTSVSVIAAQEGTWCWGDHEAEQMLWTAECVWSHLSIGFQLGGLQT